MSASHGALLPIGFYLLVIYAPKCFPLSYIIFSVPAALGGEALPYFLFSLFSRPQAGWLLQCTLFLYLDTVMETGSESIEAICGAHGEHVTAEVHDVRRTGGGRGLRREPGKRVDRMSPGRPQSVRVFVTLCEKNTMFWEVSGMGKEATGLLWNLPFLEYSTGLFFLGLFFSFIIPSWSLLFSVSCFCLLFQTLIPDCCVCP